MNVLIPVADGSEEMEVVIVVDIFRRAKWNVVIAGLGAGAIRASRGVRLVPDTAWAECHSGYLRYARDSRRLGRSDGAGEG